MDDDRLYCIYNVQQATLRSEQLPVPSPAQAEVIPSRVESPNPAPTNQSSRIGAELTQGER